jgi:thiol-disulfide isomerase/thioredoxin
MAEIQKIDAADFDNLLKDSEKLVVVEFYTTTCPNCAAIAPVYKEMASGELAKDADFTMVNVESAQELSMRYGIMGVPTFKFFCKSKVIGEIVGAVNATILRNTIKDLIKHRDECVFKSTRISYEMDGY